MLILAPGVSVSAIASGYGHTCAIVEGGGVKCWGYNRNGQLGIGSDTQQTSPVDVPGARGWLGWARGDAVRGERKGRGEGDYIYMYIYRRYFMLGGLGDGGDKKLGVSMPGGAWQRYAISPLDVVAQLSISLAACRRG